MPAGNSYTNLGSALGTDETLIFRDGAAYNQLWSVVASYMFGEGRSMLGNFTVDRRTQAANAFLIVDSDASFNSSLQLRSNGVVRTQMSFIDSAGAMRIIVYDATGGDAQYAYTAVHNGPSSIYYGASRRLMTMPNGAQANGAFGVKAQYVAATTGGATVIAADTGVLQFTQSGALAAHTLTMPDSPDDQQEVTVATGAGAITALTHNPGAGQTLRAGLTTLAADTSAKWRYRAGNTTWYRLR